MPGYWGDYFKPTYWDTPYWGILSSRTTTSNDLCQVIRSAIAGIETTLGFASGNTSQIYCHLLEHEKLEKRVGYLKGELSDGSKETRAIGVLVEDRDDPYQLFYSDVLIDKMFTIDVGLYYAPGRAALMIEHMLKIREAMAGLGTTFGGLVDFTESIDVSRPEKTEVDGMDDEFLEAHMIFVSALKGVSY